MNPNRYIDTVEMHTGGEPFRIVTHGIPRIPGNGHPRTSGLAPAERRPLPTRAHARTARACRHVRRLPRPSPSARQPISVSSSCRTSTTAHTAVTASLHWRPPPSNSAGYTGRYPRPAWASTPRVASSRHSSPGTGDDVGGVRFVNVPSFVWMLDASVDTPSFGTVTGDIAYGGAFYFYVDDAAHDLEIHDVRIEALKDFGMEVLDAANAKYAVIHPELADIVGVYGTIITSAPKQPGVDPIKRVHLRRSRTRSFTYRIRNRWASRSAACPQAARHRRRARERIHHRLDLHWSHLGRDAARPAARQSFPRFKARPTSAGSATGSSMARDPLTHGFQLRNELQTSQ